MYLQIYNNVPQIDKDNNLVWLHMKDLLATYTTDDNVGKTKVVVEIPTRFNGDNKYFDIKVNGNYMNRWIGTRNNSGRFFNYNYLSASYSSRAGEDQQGSLLYYFITGKELVGLQQKIQTTSTNDTMAIIRLYVKLDIWATYMGDSTSSKVRTMFIQGPVTSTYPFQKVDPVYLDVQPKSSQPIQEVATLSKYLTSPIVHADSTASQGYQNLVQYYKERALMIVFLYQSADTIYTTLTPVFNYTDVTPGTDAFNNHPITTVYSILSSVSSIIIDDNDTTVAVNPLYCYIVPAYFFFPNLNSLNQTIFNRTRQVGNISIYYRVNLDDNLYLETTSKLCKYTIPFYNNYITSVGTGLTKVQIPRMYKWQEATSGTTAGYYGYIPEVNIAMRITKTGLTITMDVGGEIHDITSDFSAPIIYNEAKNAYYNNATLFDITCIQNIANFISTGFTSWRLDSSFLTDILQKDKEINTPSALKTQGDGLLNLISRNANARIDIVPNQGLFMYHQAIDNIDELNSTILTHGYVQEINNATYKATVFESLIEPTKTYNYFKFGNASMAFGCYDDYLCYLLTRGIMIDTKSNFTST